MSRDSEEKCSFCSNDAEYICHRMTECRLCGTCQKDLCLKWCVPISQKQAKGTAMDENEDLPGHMFVCPVCNEDDTTECPRCMWMSPHMFQFEPGPPSHCARCWKPSHVDEDRKLCRECSLALHTRVCGCNLWPPVRVKELL